MNGVVPSVVIASCQPATPEVCDSRWRIVIARFAGPNLVVGNTILLKHAPQCPESAAVMEEIFRDAGVPADAYINIYATNDQVSTLIADPRVQGISLTGSGRAGAAVAEQAGRHLKKVVLELGGSDPFLLLGTDDMDATVEAAVMARMDLLGRRISTTVCTANRCVAFRPSFQESSHVVRSRSQA